MIRYTVLVLVAVLLSSPGPGVLYDREEISPAGQNAAPFSFHPDDPSVNDRMPPDLETKTFFYRFVAAEGATRWPTPSRIPHFFLPSVYLAGLPAILWVWRKLLCIKSRRLSIRLFMRPLGSQAPPPFPAALEAIFSGYYKSNGCGAQAA